METGKGCCHLGSSGALYFALNIRFVPTIIVWYLASNIHSRDVVWVKKYVGNVANTVLQCPEDFGLEGYNWFEMTSIAIHPTVPHMFYLSFLGCRPTQCFKFFPYEWHQWPRLSSLDSLLI
ncbi:hypothetical protein KY289_011946 [Solanum tuberosum]|nr:hypothetical protein KY289_011946 [Solanum tuberosum]